MSRSPDIIVKAIEDWRRRGMISDELAATLHADAEGVAQERGRAQLQYALGLTAGFILLLAAGAFVARNWGTLSVTWRCGVLMFVGLALVFGARLMERRARLEPVALLLRASGLGVLMAAYVYSDNAWEVGSIGALVIGVAALLTPLVSLVLSVTDRPGPTAVDTIASYGFLAIFLNRFGVHEDTIVWILDGIMVVSLLVLGWRIHTRGDHPGLSRGLTAFVASLFGGMLLVWITLAGPLDAGDNAVWALDVWLAPDRRGVVVGDPLLPAAPPQRLVRRPARRLRLDLDSAGILDTSRARLQLTMVRGRSGCGRGRGSLVWAEAFPSRRLGVVPSATCRGDRGRGLRESKRLLYRPDPGPDGGTLVLDRGSSGKEGRCLRCGALLSRRSG